MCPCPPPKGPRSRSAGRVSRRQSPESLKIRRRRRLEGHLGAGARVTQTQSPGVEHRAPETLFAAAVLAVSRDGMTESRQVNADLVGPAGVEVTAQIGRASCRERV